MKDIFFEIVEKSDYLTTFKKSFLKINVKEVLFEPSGSSDPSRELKEVKKDFRHYDIYLVVEKTYKPLTEEYIKKIIKPFMTKAFKKKLCCDSVSFGIIEKETYELTQKDLAEIKFAYNICKSWVEKKSPQYKGGPPSAKCTNEDINGSIIVYCRAVERSV